MTRVWWQGTLSTHKVMTENEIKAAFGNYLKSAMKYTHGQIDFKVQSTAYKDSNQPGGLAQDVESTLPVVNAVRGKDK